MFLTLILHYHARELIPIKLRPFLLEELFAPPGDGTKGSNLACSSSESDELPSEQARPLGTWVCQPSQPSAAGDLSHDDRRAMRSATTAMRSTHHGPLHGQRVANLVFEIVGRRLGALVLRQKMSGRRREAAIAPNRHGALFVEELESVQWP